MTVGRTYWCNYSGGVSGYSDTGNRYNGKPVFRGHNYHYSYGDTVTVTQKVYGYSEGNEYGEAMLFYKMSDGYYLPYFHEEWFTEMTPGIEM